MTPLTVPLLTQLGWLFTLAIPVACVAWTVTHEEVFREPREFCDARSKSAQSLVQRKFFYLFTCEYCFSHYVALAALWLTQFRLLVDGWRGYLLAWFALVWVANQYIGIHGRLRVSIKAERTEIAVMEEQLRETGEG
ncbi:MAG: hypothetical protein IT355_18650 [Gemmatimonadaceae bacterium]|nr:hypothetical protein [Gemmatimonadaceae bacterium]